LLWGLANYSPWLVLNQDLSLPSSEDFRHEPPTSSQNPNLALPISN
jgi:hypothetical protein